MTPLETLKAARALIEKPEHWTQGDYAQDVNGLPCTSWEARAVCFCSLGAMRHVCGGANWIYKGAGDALSDAIGGSIPAFNDTHTHAEVLAKFDEAIASLEAHL